MTAGSFTTSSKKPVIKPVWRTCYDVAGTTAWNACFPLQVKHLLQHALRLRDRREQGSISTHGLAVARGRLWAGLERAWSPNFRCPANERLANHLYANRQALFTFLKQPGADATNWRAEQALRPLVVARKVWGGNQTDGGAKTQQILGSLFRTCWQQHHPGIETLRQLLCSRHPLPLPLLSADLSPPSSHSTEPNSGAQPQPPRQSHRCRSTR